MELPQEIRDALDDKVFVHIASINPDGSPHITVVWAGRDGDKVLVSTATGRVKERNIANDPRVALSFSPVGSPYKNYTLQGRVTKSATDGKWLINSLNQKYRGKPEYQNSPDEVRVNYEITIDRARIWG